LLEAFPFIFAYSFSAFPRFPLEIGPPRAHNPAQGGNSMSEDTTQNLPGGDLGEVLSILRSMNTRLTALEDKVERRLQDTRPIWEQVLTRLTAVEERLTKVETGLKKVNDEVFMLRRKFDAWTGDVALLRQRYEDLEERFEEFKTERSK
jgi:septal ring factor EnvC (AmiA/AmiB activator)